MINIKFKKISPNAKLPTKGTDASAGFDLYACVNVSVHIAPHQTVCIPLGFATAIPDGWFCAVYARSGIATKQGLRPANCVAVIDSDYRGEWILPIHNDSDTPRVINNGDRIAQVIVQECPSVKFDVVDELDETDRGAGGFGSTGAK